MDPTRDNPLLRFNTFWWAVWTFLMFAVLLTAVILFNRKPPSSLEDAAAVARYATMDKLVEQQLTDDVKKQYAELDKAYMEQAVWAPYGNEEFTTFLSNRLDFDKSYRHLLFGQDYTSFAMK